MKTRILLAAPLSLALLVGGACDRVSFRFHHERPVREVHVVETYSVPEVRVVETHPVHHEAHVVETYPAVTVSLHFDTHVCSHGCNHYYDGTTFITLGTTHRHSAYCGHHFNGKHWVVRRGNAHKVQRHHKSHKRKHKRHD